MRILKEKVPQVVTFLLVITTFVVLYIFARNSKEAGEVYKLTDGWTVKCNDEVYENVDLSEFRLPITGLGDWIVMTNTLPEDMPDDLTMRIHTIYCVSRVLIDGSEVYNYGLDLYEKNELLGYGTQFVKMPKDFAGKDIKMTLFVTENNAFSSIAAPEFYETSKLVETFYGSQTLPLAVGITLVVAGFCISVITFILFFKSYSMERLFCIGLFALCVGAWSLCNYNLDGIFTSNLQAKVYVEFYSLYLIILPLLLYFREDVETRQKRFETFFYYLLLLVEIQLYIIAAVCQIANVTHLPTFLRLFQIVMGVCATFILYLIIMDMKNEKRHTTLVVGFVVMFVLAVRDLAVYNITKYISKSGSESDYKSYIAIGVLLFVVTMLVDFVGEMRKQMYKNAENEFLAKIAYVDVLTGVSTRRHCEEIFEKIEGRGYEYAIFQFDLNGLKEANDAFGHEAGDRLIKAFADILRTVFDNGETIGRMGGDEFIVIVTDAYDYNADEKLSNIENEINKVNADREETKVSVSYGVALSKEFENPNVHEVYTVADKRMYANKEAYYKHNGQGRRKYDKTK